MVHWFDYVMFIGMLVLSGLIGVYFGCFGTRQATTSQYLFGEKKMKVIPVAFSVAVSQFSGAVLIGVPADVYKFGASYWLICFSMIIFVFINNYVYMPVFHKLQMISAYEYLERRFDRRVKLFVVFLFVIAVTLYLPLVAYTPTLAFATVTGLNFHLTSFLVCGICVFYTAIGGLKAVIWTDLIQFAAVIVSFLSIFIVDLKSIGFLNIWKKAADGGRLDIFDFDPDPTKRETFWIIIIGYTFQMVAQVSIHQSGVQKFLSLPTFRQSVWSVVIFALSMCLVATFCVFLGLEMFARYSDCDPVLNKKIKLYDQMIPFYLGEISREVPGVNGLFLAALLSAALSTISSNLNALAAALYNDYLKKYFKNISETKASNILKLIVVVDGVICICLASFINQIKGGIFALVITLSATTIGPLLGVFTLGFLFPRANAQGGFYGVISGFLITACVIIPAYYYQSQGLLEYPHKPFSAHGCQIFNENAFNNSTNITNNDTLSNNLSSYTHQPSFIFRLSFYYYTLLGTMTTIVIGLIISYLSRKNNQPVDRNLISPICHFLLPKEGNGRDGVKYSSVERELQDFQ